MSHCQMCDGTNADCTPCPGCGHEATIATLTAEREALRAATRKVVEAGDIMSMLFEVHWTVKDTAEGVYASVWNWKVALSDPVIVALGRE